MSFEGGDDLADGGVDQADVADSDRGNRLVAAGDRAHRGRRVGVVPDVDSLVRNAVVLELAEQAAAETTARAPVHRDGGRGGGRRIDVHGLSTR